jgi:hypothetical protein
MTGIQLESTIAHRNNVGERIGKTSGNLNSIGLSMVCSWVLTAFQYRGQSCMSRLPYFRFCSDRASMGIIGAPILCLCVSKNMQERGDALQCRNSLSK